MKNILSILLLLLAFTACGDKSSLTDVLNRAEALMNEHPDSALNLLRTLTFDDFQKEKNRARYALLHSQALDKNYIDVTSDSLISVAVDYYKDTDDVRNKFLSYYYMGRVHVNGGNSLNAMLSFTKAEQLEEEIRDSLALGLLYSQLGDLYREYYDFPKSLVAYQKAEICYGQASKEQHRLYAMLDQFYVNRNIGDIDKCFQLLNEIRSNAERKNDKVLIRKILGCQMLLYVQEDSIEKALLLYEELRSHYDLDNKTSVFWGCVSRMFALHGNISDAHLALKRGWELTKTTTDSIILYGDAAKVFQIFKQYDKAYWHLETATILQNRVMKESLQQPVLTVQRDYLSEKLEYEAYRLRMEKHLRVLYVVIFSMLLSLVVFVLYRKLKKEKEKARKTILDLQDEKKRIEDSYGKMLGVLQDLEAESNVNVASINQLRLELKHQEEEAFLSLQKSEDTQRTLQDEIQKMDGQISVLLKERLDFMGNWILLYEEEWNSKDAKEQHISKEILYWKQKYFAGDKAYKELERMVNVYRNDIMAHFRQEISLSDEMDYRKVCCLFSGMSVPVMAWMFGDTVDAIYQRKRRLKKKIASSLALHRDLFLSYLDN